MTMIILHMTSKGFTETNANIETPNDINITEKPLKSDPNISQRVDINVLKAKLEKTESEAVKKNITILSVLIVGLGVLGIYFSL